MKARLAFHDKQVLPDGSIVEMKIWEVPQSVPGSRHRLKYSLFYGRPGQRLIGYDNERGRGDHRHSEGKDQPYTFSTPEQLIEDFWRMCAAYEVSDEQASQSARRYG